MENTETIYKVKTSAFEGPLELLLNLVESRKLFINEISLATVTDDFLAYSKSLPKEDLSEITSFLSVAATLILIKSRSLLPGFVVTKEEEKDIHDLEARLALYSMIREIGVSLSEKYGMSVIHLPPERQQLTTVFAPDPTLSIPLLRNSVLSVLANVPKEEILPEVRVRKVISIEEMIDKLTHRFLEAAKISFKQWRESVGDEDPKIARSNVIVSFLAMLELVRGGLMDAVQGSAFDDIELTAVTEQQEVAE